MLRTLGSFCPLKCASVSHSARKVFDPHPGWASRQDFSVSGIDAENVLRTPVAGRPMAEARALRPSQPWRRHLRTVHLDQPICSAISRSVCPISANSHISTRSSMVVALPMAIPPLWEKHGPSNGSRQIQGVQLSCTSGARLSCTPQAQGLRASSAHLQFAGTSGTPERMANDDSADHHKAR